MNESLNLNEGGLGPYVVTCTPTTSNFYDKQKSPKKNLRVDYNTVQQNFGIKPSKG